MEAFQSGDKGGMPLVTAARPGGGEHKHHVSARDPSPQSQDWQRTTRTCCVAEFVVHVGGVGVLQHCSGVTPCTIHERQIISCRNVWTLGNSQIGCLTNNSHVVWHTISIDISM